MPGSSSHLDKGDIRLRLRKRLLEAGDGTALTQVKLGVHLRLETGP